MADPITIAIIAAALLGAGAAATAVIRSWADIEASPGVALELIANNIESDPARIITVLRTGATQIISPEGIADPIRSIKNSVKELIGVNESLTDALETPMQIPEYYRKGGALLYNTLMTSLADNLAGGPSAVAAVVAALRSAEARTKAAGDNLELNPYWMRPMAEQALLNPSADIYFAEIFYDLAITITPSLNDTIWKDIRPGRSVLPKLSTTMTLIQKKMRGTIINFNMTEFQEMELCKRGWDGTQRRPTRNSITCVDTSYNERVGFQLDYISIQESNDNGNSNNSNLTLRAQQEAYRERIAQHLQFLQQRFLGTTRPQDVQGLIDFLTPDWNNALSASAGMINAGNASLNALQVTAIGNGNTPQLAVNIATHKTRIENYLTFLASSNIPDADQATQAMVTQLTDMLDSLPTTQYGINLNNTILDELGINADGTGNVPDTNTNTNSNTNSNSNTDTSSSSNSNNNSQLTINIAAYRTRIVNYLAFLDSSNIPDDDVATQAMVSQLTDMLDSMPTTQSELDNDNIVLDGLGINESGTGNVPDTTTDTTTDTTDTTGEGNDYEYTPEGGGY
jgi:hypothetical protein